jgi:hypothetical protein
MKINLNGNLVEFKFDKSLIEWFFKEGCLRWRIVMIERDPILVEREKTHGSFVRVAEMSRQLKQIIYKNNMHAMDNRQLEAADMICMKLARIVCGNPKEKDHWDDIAGYAKLGSEACE